MKGLLGFLFLVSFLLSGCSGSSLEGTWILTAGQEDKGCTQRFTFLEKGNVEVQNEGERPFVATYEQVGDNQYKMDTKTQSNLVQMKVINKKLHVKVSGGTEQCFYDQINL